MNIALLNSFGKHCCFESAQNFSMHIGQRIKKLMKDKGVSPQVMAAHCEVTPGAVSNWFSTGRISKPNLAKAAALLQVSADELISDDGEVRIGWPFPTIAPSRFERLTPEQKLEIQGVVRHMIQGFESDEGNALRNGSTG